MKSSTAVVIATCLAVVVIGCTPDRREDPAVTAQLRQQAAAASARETSERADCLANRAARITQHAAFMARREFMLAYGAVANCGALTSDKDLAALADKARIADLEATAADTKLSGNDRLTALEALRREYPEKVAGTERLLAKLASAAESDRSIESRKHGVTIGMTQAQVLQSSWGKPRDVNRTTYADVVKEQWVYPGGYLYFTNGKLDAIQN